MQVIITMAGRGQRFKDQAHRNKNYQAPKPFVKVKDKYVIEHLVEQFPNHWKLFFVVNQELDSKYIHFLKTHFVSATVVQTEYSSRGPLDTVLSALPFVSLDEPTIVTYCDYTLRWDVNHFEKTVYNKQVDAAVVGYTGFHPTFLGPNSYCHYLVNEGQILELQEKKLYTGQLETEWTSCGLYYFKSAVFLQECLAEQQRQDLNYNGKEFYTSLALQAMKNVNPKIQILNYPISSFIQMGTPFDIEWVITNNQL